MEKLKRGVEFIFSSYKRTAAIFFVAALILAIPITVSLVSQQQDVRSRACKDYPKLGIICGKKVSSSTHPCDPSSPGCEAPHPCDVDRDSLECENAIKDALTLPNAEPETSEPGTGGTDGTGGNPCGNGTLVDGQCYLCSEGYAFQGGTCVFTGGSVFVEPESTRDIAIKAHCDAVSQQLGATCSPSGGGGCSCPDYKGSTFTEPLPTQYQFNLDDPEVAKRLEQVPATAPQSQSATGAGNQQQTTTGQEQAAEQTSTKASVAIGLVGIGTDAAKGQNVSPKRPQRTVSVKILNAQNQEVANPSGQLAFTQGKFAGQIELSNVQTGPYTIKVKLDNTLWKALPGIQNIVRGQLFVALPIDLVSGDINQDNELNIQDYTALITCITNQNCQNKTLADLNDDGKVDELDLNILYAGFSKRKGD